MMGFMLPPLSRAALDASNLVIGTYGKSAAQLATEHDAAAEAHRRVAAGDSPLKWMHGEHARIHEETARAMRKIGHG